MEMTHFHCLKGRSTDKDPHAMQADTEIARCLNIFIARNKCTLIEAAVGATVINSVTDYYTISNVILFNIMLLDYIYQHDATNLVTAFHKKIRDLILYMYQALIVF